MRIRIEVRGASSSSRFRSPFRRRPDVWLTQDYEEGLVGDAPVVVINHGSPWTVERAFWDLVPREFGERFVAATELVLSTASCVITPSEYTRQGLVEHYGLPDDRVFAVPHGVDRKVFHPGRLGGHALVEGRLGERRPYVLFASIPSIPQKNLAALREAVRRLVVAGLPHALVIAGGTAGGESADVLAQIEAEFPGEPGRVAWLGAVGDEQLAGLMAEADAFCLPSYFESFGLTALEAMACGAPVVVSNRGALPEVVGGAGVTCEPSPEALESALFQVLTSEDHARRLRAAGPARAAQMSWARTADGWLQALRLAAKSR